MVLTAPLSSSTARQFISVAHAASASSSTSVSRLSSSDSARAVLASVGSASASFRISAASRFIVRFYPPERLRRTVSRTDLERSTCGLHGYLTQRRGGGGGGGGVRAPSSPLPGGVLHHESDH